MLTPDDFREAWRRSRFRCDPLARCPHCRCKLTDSPAVVIATRHCPKCGGRVLGDPAEPQQPVEQDTLIPLAEFRAASERFNGIFAAIICISLICWLVGMVVSATLTGPRGLRTPEWVDILIMAWAVVGPPAVGILVGNYWYHRARWIDSIACPWCGEGMSLLYPVVCTTRCCTTCGRVAILEEASELAPPPATPLLSVAEFATRIRRHGRANWWGVLICLAVTCTIGAPALLPFAVMTRFDLEIWLTRRIGEDEAYHLMEYGPLVACIVGLIVGITVSRLYYVRATRTIPLKCPHCVKEYSMPGLVLASRRCVSCYRAVVDETATP